MTDLPLALLLGLVAGFFGAIPPGPLNVTIIRHASHARVRQALRVALGGAVVDTAICAFVAVGLGWILEEVATNRWVKGTLALFLLGYGLKIVLFDRRTEEEIEAAAPDTGTVNDPCKPSGSGASASLRDARDAGLGAAGLHFLVGILQGAVNPALLVNWTLFVSFAVGHGLLSTAVPSAGAFALGTGCGTFGWFATLVELTLRVRNHRFGVWIREATLVAGILLAGFGIYYTWQWFGELLRSAPH